MNKNLLTVLIMVPVALLLWGYAVIIGPQTKHVDERPDVSSPTELAPPVTTPKEAEVQPVSEDTAAESLGEYTVSKVIDGDTVIVGDGTEFLTVRVLGIDAPETIHSPHGAECFNTDATLEADRLLAGQTVTLATDPTQDTFDTYNRLLAYITLPDGTDFGEKMIAGGFAEEYTFKGRAYLKQSTYKAAEQNAHEQKLGLWNCK